MRARMRRLSVSIDSSSDLQQHHHHHHHHQFHHQHSHQSSDIRGTDASNVITESRIDRVKKLLSSPLSRRKSASSSSSSSFGSFSTSITASTKGVFGVPLSTIAQVDPPLSSSSPSTTSTEVDPSSSVVVVKKPPAIPYVITRLCNFIEAHESGFKHEGLFRISANVKLVDRLKHSFDETGDAPLEEVADVASAAALLKLFLRELPDPVIPSHLHQPFFAAVRDYVTNERNGIERMRALVAVLPPKNFYLLKYLCSFLHRVSLYESQNRMNSSSLGIVFGPNFFRLSADEYKDFSYANQMVDIFIREHAYIFDQEVVNTLNTLRQDSLSSFINRPVLPSSPPTKSRGSILGIKRKSSGPPTLLNSHNHIIPILALNNEVLPPSVRTKAFPKTSSLTQNLRQRRQSKLLGPDIAGGFYMPVRSHSEERPSSTDVSSVDDFLDIRRCSSTDEVSCLTSSSFFCTSIPESDSPSSEPKRRQSPTEEQEEKDKDVFSSFTSATTATTTEIKITEENKETEENSNIDDVEDTVTVTRRPNFDRKRRLSAIASCKMAQFQTDKWKVVDEDDVTIDDVNNNNEVKECPDILEYKDTSDMFEGPISQSDCLSVPSSSVEHRNSWPRESKDRNLKESTSDIHLSSYPLSTLTDPWNRKCSGPVTEAPVSPSAFRSYLSNRVKRLSDPAVAPSPPLECEDFSIGSNRTVSKRDAKRRIALLKKSLKKFEVDFETRTGRKPTIEEKSSSSIAPPILLEIHRLKRGLKDSFEVTNDDDFSLSLRRPQPIPLSPTSDGKLDPKSLEEMMKNLEELLKIRRNLAGRSEDINEMSKEQIIEEKLDLQKALLRFESTYGRPENKRDRDIMRPMYDRYRNVKRALARTHSSSKEQSLSDLQPIYEHKVMTSFESSTSIDSTTSSQDKSVLLNRENKDKADESESPIMSKKYSSPVIEQNLHELPLNDLLDHLQQSRQEKRQIRRMIKSFEDDFYTRIGRKVEKEDRTHLEPLYTSYKQVKGKLRLLEALVSKCEKGQYV